MIRIPGRPAKGAGPARPPGPPEKQPGSQPAPIPRYRVGEPLRRGLLGETFIGYADDGAPVALTRLDARWTGHPEMPRHLERAAARARDTPAPGTVAVRGVLPPGGPDAESCYVVTEYVAAPTLDALLRRTGTLPAPLALWLAESVAWALCGLVAHRRSHGALDPATILCTEQGPLLCEHSLVIPLNRAASRLGTPGAAPTHPDFATRYLAPEVTQRTGWGGAAADVFSLGMILQNAVSRTSYPGGEELARLVAACVRPRAKGRPSVPKVARLAFQARQATGFTADWARSEWASRLARATLPDGGPVRIGGAGGTAAAGSPGAVWSAGSGAARSAAAGSGGAVWSDGAGAAGSGGTRSGGSAAAGSGAAGSAGAARPVESAAGSGRVVWSEGSAAAGSAAAGSAGAGSSGASAPAGSAGVGRPGGSAAAGSAAGPTGAVWPAESAAGAGGAGNSGASAPAGSAGAGSGGFAAAGSAAAARPVESTAADPAAAAVPGVLSPAEAAWSRRTHRLGAGPAGSGGRPGDRLAEPAGRQSGGSPSPSTAAPDSALGAVPGSVENVGRGPAYDESWPTAPESGTGRAPVAPAATAPGDVEHAGRGPAYDDSPSTAPVSRRTGRAPVASEPTAPAAAAPASTRPASAGPAPETGDLAADPRLPAESRPRHFSRPLTVYGTGRGMRPFRAAAPRGGGDPAARPLPDGGWTVDLGFLPDAPLAYANGVLYVAGADRDGGVLLAVDSRGGTRRWEFRDGGPYRARPVPYRDSVLLAGRDGVLYVLRAATGEVESSVRVDDPLGSAPAVVGDQVWLGGVSGLLQRVDLRDGTVRQVRPPGEPADVLAGSALAGPGGLWLPTATGLHRLAADGSVFWSRPDLGDLNGCGIALDGGRLFGGTPDGRVYACDAASGELLWETPAGEAVTGPPLVAGGAVHVGTSHGAEGAVRAYDPASGRLLTAVELPSAVTGPPVWAAGKVVAATRDRRLRALSVENGHYAPGWSWRAGGRIGRCGPYAGDGLVFTGSSDCHLYAVAARDGTGGPPGALRIDPEIDAALTVLFNGAG